MLGPLRSSTVSYVPVSLFPNPSIPILVSSTFLFLNGGVVNNSWVLEIKRSWGSCFSQWACPYVASLPKFPPSCWNCSNALLVQTCLPCKNVLQQSQDNAGLFYLDFCGSYIPSRTWKIYWRPVNIVFMLANMNLSLWLLWKWLIFHFILSYKIIQFYRPKIS